MTFASRPRRPGHARSLMALLGQLPFAGRLSPRSHADTGPRGPGYDMAAEDARALRTGERASHW